MTRSVTLDARQRQALLDRYRKDHDPEVRFRAHILLLLADGHTWATVCTLLFWNSRTIDRWVQRFHQEGVEGLVGHKPGRPFRFAVGGIATVVEWVTQKAPHEFGFLRSRWCCEAVAVLMLELHGVRQSLDQKVRLSFRPPSNDPPRADFLIPVITMKFRPSPPLGHAGGKAAGPATSMTAARRDTPRRPDERRSRTSAGISKATLYRYLAEQRRRTIDRDRSPPVRKFDGHR